MNKQMISVFSVLIGVSLVITSLVFADHNPNHNPGGGNSGAIWTTDGSCGDSQQDVNQFAHGDVVYINGSNFDPNTSYDWDVTGQPGNASSDPNIDVASGNFTTDDTGAFCFPAYTVADDDCGEYSVKFGNKGDNYHVFDISCQEPSPSPSADPTATPSAEPSSSPEPTSTPEPTDPPCEGNDCPEPSATPSANPTPAPSDNNNTGGANTGGGSSSNDNNSSSSESKSEGQILSASTMAPTGILDQLATATSGFLGVLSALSGSVFYVKKRFIS